MQSSMNQPGADVAAKSVGSLGNGDQFRSQRPQALGLPEHSGMAASFPPDAANTESFFSSFVDSHLGHSVPVQFDDWTKASNSFLQSVQTNS